MSTPRSGDRLTAYDQCMTEHYPHGGEGIRYQAARVYFAVLVSGVVAIGLAASALAVRAALDDPFWPTKIVLALIAVIPAAATPVLLYPAALRRLLRKASR